MKKSTAIALLAALLTLTGCGRQEQIRSEDLAIDGSAQVDASIVADVEEAAQLLVEQGGASEAVWPGYTLPRNAIVVCLRDDDTNKVIRAWELTTQGKTELTNEQLAGTEIPGAGAYNSTVFQGKKAIIMSLSTGTVDSLKKVAVRNYIFEIGTHEMVHFHYESPLKLMKLANEQKKHGGRGTAFPKEAQPRVYRKMLYDNLAAAFDNPGEEELYLGRAKFWNEKWREEYPGEYYQTKITDIMEGKARYIQYMLCIPKDLSQEERTAWISDHLDRSPEPSVSMDSESYKLGFAAGVLLDRQGVDWKNQMSKKPEPPVELLLKNVEAVADSMDAFGEKLGISLEQMGQINAELSEKLADIEQAETDTGIPFLELSDKFMAGSFETTDFLRYLDQKITVDFGTVFENKNGRLVLDRVAVYDRDGIYVLPLTMAYECKDGRLTIHDGGVSGDILVKQSAGKDGRVIYTME